MNKRYLTGLITAAVAAGYGLGEMDMLEAQAKTVDQIITGRRISMGLSATSLRQSLASLQDGVTSPRSKKKPWRQSAWVGMMTTTA
jgi:hypothetical protein